jgi:hypothetical protein
MAVARKKVSIQAKDEKQELLQDLEAYVLKNQSAELIAGVC